MPSALNLAKLEDRRRQLIRYIEHYRPHGSANNRVTVVFDGNLENFGAMKSSVAKVVFSQGESADDKIKNIVAQAKNAKNIVVVSDDRDIQYAVRALGAKTSGTRKFLNKVKDSTAKKKISRKNPEKSGTSESRKVISKREEFKITAEVGQIWLGSNKKRKSSS